ncbi:MAG: hypothetical protein EBW55_04785 [Betaproteobacteria bacterium]|nr:hypothetical protein [Betaproteobacteria bacterium]
MPSAQALERWLRLRLRSLTSKKGTIELISRDEHPRADTSLESLAKLKPATKPIARTRVLSCLIMGGLL